MEQRVGAGDRVKDALFTAALFVRKNSTGWKKNCNFE